MENEKEVLQLREIFFEEFKNHVLFIGNEILDDSVSAKDFWQRLKRLCL